MSTDTVRCRDVGTVSTMAASKAPSGVKSIFELIDEQRAAEDAADLRELLKEQNAESEIVFMGSKQSGKSSLIMSFIGKTDQPKPSTALEFKYARYSPKDGNMQVVANIWEMAGDAQASQLLDVVIVPGKLARTQVVIVVDLSKPSTVLSTLSGHLAAVRKRVEACLRDVRKTDQGQRAAKQLQAKLPPATPECSPVGVPVLIVANKWDAFEQASQTSTENLQVMAKTLRYLAHANGAALIYTREKDKVRAAAANHRRARLTGRAAYPAPTGPDQRHETHDLTARLWYRAVGRHAV